MAITTTNLTVSNTTNNPETIPTNVASSLSQTSDALECFTNQQFSARLQAYLASYVLAVDSYYSLFSGFNPK